MMTPSSAEKPAESMTPYGTPPSASPARKPVTTAQLTKMHANGEKVAMVTCYDASFAQLLDQAGVDILLIGDSLGMVLQGHPSTLPVTLKDIAYHTACVARVRPNAMIVADLPFASYQASPSQALEASAEVMRAGAHMVKLEGGVWLAPTIQFLVERGIPVCAHIGFTPQSVYQFGGYKVQGRGNAAAQTKAEGQTLISAGASLLLMEMVPRALATEITQASPVPTIGIGAGPGCSGQVLVLHDLLGVTATVGGPRPRFVRNFLQDHGNIAAACRAYVSAVKDGSFPAPEHCFD